MASSSGAHSGTGTLEEDGSLDAGRSLAHASWRFGCQLMVMTVYLALTSCQGAKLHVYFHLICLTWASLPPNPRHFATFPTPWSSNLHVSPNLRKDKSEAATCVHEKEASLQ